MGRELPLLLLLLPTTATAYVLLRAPLRDRRASAPTALADRNEETTGAIKGAVLGGLVAGPFGALWGAQLGSAMGANAAQKRSANERFNSMGIDQSVLKAAQETASALEEVCAPIAHSN
jgi:uncharacterized protein YcfJ